MRIFLAAVVFAGSALAQTPAFEVATIKVNDSGSGGSNFPALNNGTLSTHNVSLKLILQVAYDLNPLRIIGPEWLDTTRFDLTAKSPPGVPDSAMMPMLQALLKERFHVEVHREMKELPVYEMVIAKGGVKMPPYDPERKFTGINPHGNMIFAPSSTMPEPATRMSASAGRPVIDKTGLERRYSAILMFTRRGATGTEAEAPDAPPDFFTAVQKQIGPEARTEE